MNPLHLTLAVLLCFSCQSANSQDSVCPILDKYVEVCNAQKNCLEIDQQWQTVRLDSISELRKKGFASWLELKRQQFKVDSNSTKLDALRDYINFMKTVSKKINLEHPNFDECTAKATRVFLPGSIRLVGWMHGVKLKDYSINVEYSNAQLELEIANRMLASAERRKNNSVGQDDTWSQRIELDIRVAQNTLTLRRLEVEFCKLVKAQLESAESFGADRAVRTVSPGDDEAFQAIVFQLAKLESSDVGQTQLINRYLNREQRRLSALKKLAVYGHSTERDIQILKDQIAKLQITENRIRLNQTHLEESTKGLICTKKGSEQTAGYLPVEQWPESAFSNSSRVQYLIQQRRACYEELARARMSELQLTWMKEIVDRLESASARMANSIKTQDRFSGILDKGQKRELEDYRWKIETIELARKNAQSKMLRLQLEEKRFLQQSVLMDQQIPGDIEFVSDIKDTSFLTSILTTLESSSLRNKVSTSASFGYIESDLLESVGEHVELIFSQKPGYPLGSFAANNELLRPVKLKDYSQSLNFARRKPVRISVGPATSGTITSTGSPASGYRSRNKDIAAPSLYNSPYATDHYRANQIQSNRVFNNAYPFGILRSDLRRFARFSQAPWYLPGWPDNLRSNQLRADYKRSLKGNSGHEELKSRNYLDLTRPDYVN